MTADRRVLCPAGHLLGVRMGPLDSNLITVRHRGREVVAAQVISIRCDQCGALWLPNGAPASPTYTSVPAFTDLEVK